MIIRTALTAVALAGTTACASMTGYRIAYNGDQRGYRPEQTPSIYVLANSQNYERTIDIKDRRVVEGALMQMGYKITSEEKADVYLLIEAWLDTTTIKTLASVIRPQTVIVEQGPGGKGRTIRMPERMGTVPTSVQLNFPRMTMIAVDANQVRTSNEAKILWRGDTLLPRRGLLVRDAVPYLMVPLVSSFGTQSRGITLVEVSREQTLALK